MRLEALARHALLFACIALVGWIRATPLALDGPDSREEVRSQYRFTSEDGREWVYLGDFDSYLWLRQARSHLQRGSTCDEVAGGVCRDTHSNAPVGRIDRYSGSLHALAIATLHRLLALFDPARPLSASAFLVPVLIAMLGVLPSFALGYRLAGPIGAVAASLIIGTNSVFLVRSVGSDNDVWNVVLPLFIVWAGVAAIAAKSLARAVLLAAVAGCAVGIHAAVWRGWVFGYAVLFAGLAAAALVRLLRVAPSPRRAAAFASAAGAGLVPLAVFYVGAGIAVSVVGADEPYWTLPMRVVAGVVGEVSAPPPSGAESAEWPDVLATVAELTRPNLSSIANLMGGTAFFFVGWLGLIVLVLPRRDWRWWHFALLIAGNYVYQYLLTTPEIGRGTLILLLGLPLGVALRLSLLNPVDDDAADGGAALVVIVWFLAALYLSYSGLRFVLLLVAPFGLACAVAIGRLHLSLVRALDAAPWPARAWKSWLRSVVFVAFAAAMVWPLARGLAVARVITPSMNDAWWDALAAIDRGAPPDAIVTSWWDYGYWIEYIANRRATADGGSLTTHIPHWIGRALLAADESEGVGLLRMLDCGSDATPEPEGQRGAYGILVRRGIDAAAAPALIAQLAARNREAAAALLTERGLDPAARDEVLAATHCVPPPAYLVLTTKMIRQSAWRAIGGWGFERAAGETPKWAAVEAEARLRQQVGAEEEPAMVEGASPHGEAEPKTTVVQTSDYTTPDWVPCRARGGGVLACDFARAGGRRLRFVYDPAVPVSSRFELLTASGAEPIGAPGTLLIAAASLERVRVPAAAHPDSAVLVDAAHGRVLIGGVSAIGSMFTQLVFLDGRYTRHFTRLGEQQAPNGERVLTWRIDWDGR